MGALFLSFLLVCLLASLAFTSCLDFKEACSSLQARRGLPDTLPKMVSTLDCSQKTATCVGKNLYYDGNGTFFAFLENSALAEICGHSGLNVITGHGSSSPVIPVTCDFSGAFPKTPYENQGLSPAVRVCSADTAETSALKQAPVHKTPVALFSVMWDNLFRTLYAGFSAWYTMHEHHVYFPGKFSHVLVDAIGDFERFSFLQWLKVAAGTDVIHWSALRAGWYELVLLGISRNSAIAELEFQTPATDPFFRAKSWVLRSFRAQFVAPLALRTSGRSTLLLVRKNPQKYRLLLNEREICRSLPNCTIVSFDAKANKSLSDQVRLVGSGTVTKLVAVHGAGLVHLLFLNHPEASVIEIFPTGFYKTVYRNLARLLGTRYLAIEASSGFSSSRVPVPALYSGSLRRVGVDWSSQVSRDLWRSQNVRCSALQAARANRLIDNVADATFLLYMPFEQLGNQMNEFTTACAIAAMLNRTLVVPAVRFKAVGIPFSSVFNAKKLYSGSQLPCSAISMDNFKSLLLDDARVGKLFYTVAGENTTTLAQVKHYYTQSCGLPIDSITANTRRHHFHLSAERILKLYQRETVAVIGLSNVFWYYSFGARVEFPLTRYYYEIFQKSSIYRQIASALDFSAYHYSVYYKLWGSVVTAETHTVAVHLRLGDYDGKCAALPMHLQAKCWPNESQIVETIAGVLRNVSSSRLAIYLLSNMDTLSVHFRQLVVQKLKQAFVNATVMTIADLLEAFTDVNALSNNPLEILSDLDLAIVDQIIAIQCNVFIGNIYSSFTRAIVDRRALLHSDSSFF